MSSQRNKVVISSYLLRILGLSNFEKLNIVRLKKASLPDSSRVRHLVPPQLPSVSSFFSSTWIWKILHVLKIRNSIPKIGIKGTNHRILTMPFARPTILCGKDHPLSTWAVFRPLNSLHPLKQIPWGIRFHSASCTKNQSS